MRGGALALRFLFMLPIGLNALAPMTLIPALLSGAYLSLYAAYLVWTYFKEPTRGVVSHLLRRAQVCTDALPLVVGVGIYLVSLVKGPIGLLPPRDIIEFFTLTLVLCYLTNVLAQYHIGWAKGVLYEQDTK